MGARIFGVTPTWVYVVEEEYNVITNVSENLKKEYFLPEETPNRQYRLLISGCTDTTFNNILAFWRDVSGTYDSFYWNSVPSYIDGGEGLGVSMFGRWVGQPTWTPKAKSHWEVEMVFEKE